MTKKSDLLDIDLNEELAAIRTQKFGKNVLRKKKLKDPAGVATIRHRLGLTQEAFSGLLGISIQTLRNWEQGTRKPRGPAKALLRIVEKNPEVLFS